MTSLILALRHRKEWRWYRTSMIKVFFLPLVLEPSKRITRFKLLIYHFIKYYNICFRRQNPKIIYKSWTRIVKFTKIVDCWNGKLILSLFTQISCCYDALTLTVSNESFTFSFQSNLPSTVSEFNFWNLGYQTKKNKKVERSHYDGLRSCWKAQKACQW